MLRVGGIPMHIHLVLGKDSEVCLNIHTYFYRSDPPTEAEIAQNLAIAQMKKINAAKLETKRLSEGGAVPAIPERGAQSFPVYPDIYPGDPKNFPSN